MYKNKKTIQFWPSIGQIVSFYNMPYIVATKATINAITKREIKISKINPIMKKYTPFCKKSFIFINNFNKIRPITNLSKILIKKAPIPLNENISGINPIPIVYINTLVQYSYLLQV